MRSVLSALDALKEISRPGALWLWARPVSWRGSGSAICIDRGEWKFVPTPRGGHSASLPAPADLFGEWEVLTPETVNTEHEDYSR